MSETPEKGSTAAPINYLPLVYLNSCTLMRYQAASAAFADKNYPEIKVGGRVPWRSEL